MKEEKVIIKSGVDLGATVSYLNNKKKKPLVVILMGTGKTNRDGNTKSFKTDFYKNLSDLFVNLGCVTIRYDKRGTHESSGNYKMAGLSDLVDDAISVIKYGKTLEYVNANKVIVCGHSEGAMIATLLTQKIDVNGLILLGGAGMCMKSALIYQNLVVLNQYENKKGFIAWYLKKILTKEKIEKQFEDLFKKAEKANKGRYFFNGALFNTKYMKEHGSLTDDSFIDILNNYSGKVLAITGTSDLSADYHSLEKLNSNIKVYAPQKVNHILRQIDDDNDIMKVKKQYKRLSTKDIDKFTKDVIISWIDTI